MNQEIVVQNEELMTVNDQLNERTEELNQQNDRLIEAQDIIHEQHEKLLSHSKDLEDEVERRTQEIRSTNIALVKSNSQMEQFTYAISHNLRGPIARLLGLINIMGYADPQEHKLILEKVKQSSFDLDNVIKDLNMILDSKYKEKEVLESIDLQVKLEKTKQILDRVIEESGAEIESDFSGGHIIYANRSYIESIFYNLISNSIKYRSPEHPCIIKIATEVHNNSFVLSFSDNGRGIDLQKHGDKVFGLYKRFHLEVEGKGVGLYLVKSHTQSMGGEIEIESTPELGTTFRIFLPIQKLNVNSGVQQVSS
jgi:signal transduction histidine kinase